MTAGTREYLEIGRRSAETLVRILDDEGVDVTQQIRVLDFGCGLGRTLRWLVDRTAWRLEGCDVDERSLAWTASAFPSLPIRVTAAFPPLSWADGSFDVIYAISVFTHFAEAEQTVWGRELGRLLRPGGRLIVSSMGPHALGAFPDLATPRHREILETDGFLFVSADSPSFNSRGAFHLAPALEGFVGPDLELAWWREGGLDGFQDVSLFRSSRVVCGDPSEGGDLADR